MCMALPSRVERIDGLTAVVEAGGQQRTVSLELLDREDVQVGDYLLVRNGRFAYERMDADAARASLALIEELIQRSGGAEDLRTWGRG